MSESLICALQLPTLPMSEARLDYYFKICADKGARLVVLGEYVLNSFFSELESAPKSIIKEQSERKRAALLALCAKYNLICVAPIVLARGKELVKSVAKFSPSGVKFYEQQILMPYSHWNEAKFYANKPADTLNFATFSHDKFKIGVMMGFEAHFDACWQAMSHKKVDLVLVPTACTFGTQARWEELLKMRAFTHNIYVLRVNRVGAYRKSAKSEELWNFYGDSFLISPFGEVLQRLGENEEMLLANVDKKELSAARGLWSFSSIAAKFKI